MIRIILRKIQREEKLKIKENQVTQLRPLLITLTLKTAEMMATQTQ